MKASSFKKMLTIGAPIALISVLGSCAPALDGGMNMANYSGNASGSGLTTITAKYGLASQAAGSPTLVTVYTSVTDPTCQRFASSITNEDAFVYDANYCGNGTNAINSIKIGSSTYNLATAWPISPLENIQVLTLTLANSKTVYAKIIYSLAGNPLILNLYDALADAQNGADVSATQYTVATGSKGTSNYLPAPTYTSSTGPTLQALAIIDKISAIYSVGSGSFTYNVSNTTKYCITDNSAIDTATYQSLSVFYTTTGTKECFKVNSPTESTAVTFNSADILSSGIATSNTVNGFSVTRKNTLANPFNIYIILVNEATTGGNTYQAFTVIKQVIKK